MFWFVEHSAFFGVDGHNLKEDGRGRWNAEIFVMGESCRKWEVGSGMVKENEGKIVQA